MRCNLDEWQAFSQHLLVILTSVVVISYVWENKAQVNLPVWVAFL
jgi:hypothetical protein